MNIGWKEFKYINLNLKNYNVNYRFAARDLDGYNLSSQIEHATQSLVISCDKQLHQKTTTKNVASVKVPRYKHKTVWFPASFWDHFKFLSRKALDRLRQFMKNIRYYDEFIKSSPVTDFEDWLLNRWEIRYKMNNVVAQEKIGEDEFVTRQEINHTCPHISPNSTDRDCVAYLAAETNEARDLEVLRAAAQIFRDIKEIIKNDSKLEYYYSYGDKATEYYRFECLMSRLDDVLKRR